MYLGFMSWFLFERHTLYIFQGKTQSISSSVDALLNQVRGHVLDHESLINTIGAVRLLGFSKPKVENVYSEVDVNAAAAAAIRVSEVVCI